MSEPVRTTEDLKALVAMTGREYQVHLEYARIAKERLADAETRHQAAWRTLDTRLHGFDNS